MLFGILRLTPLLFFIFFVTTPGWGWGAVCVLRNCSEVTQPCDSSSICCPDCFQHHPCSQTFDLCIGRPPLPCLGTDFSSLSFHMSSGSMVWEFAGLLVVLTWLLVCVCGMGRWDSMLCRVPVGPEALGGTGTFHLLSSSFCPPPGLFTYLLFSVCHTCHSPFTTLMSSDLSRTIVCGTF